MLTVLITIDEFQKLKRGFDQHVVDGHWRWKIPIYQINDFNRSMIEDKRIVVFPILGGFEDAANTYSLEETDTKALTFQFSRFHLRDWLQLNKSILSDEESCKFFNANGNISKELPENVLVDLSPLLSTWGITFRNLKCLFHKKKQGDITSNMFGRVLSSRGEQTYYKRDWMNYFSFERVRRLRVVSEFLEQETKLLYVGCERSIVTSNAKLSHILYSGVSPQHSKPEYRETFEKCNQSDGKGGCPSRNVNSRTTDFAPSK